MPIRRAPAAANWSPWSGASTSTSTASGDPSFRNRLVNASKYRARRSHGIRIVADIRFPSCETGGPGIAPVPPLFRVRRHVDARVDRELVLHFGDAGGIAGGALGIPHLGVGAHGAAQNRLVALELDTDALSIELGAPFQRLPDPLLYVGRGRPRPHGDQVRHALDARQVADFTLRRLLLVVPVHVTLEREQPLLDLHLNPVLRHVDVPPEGVDRGVRDLGIGPRRARGELHFEIVGDGLHPLDLAGHPLGGPLVAVAVHEARERDYAVPDAHGDVVIPETGLPPQLGDDVFLNLHVGTHDILP